MKRLNVIPVLLAAILALVVADTATAQRSPKVPEGVTELELGTKAPSFTLPGTDGKEHSLESVRGAKGTMIVFTCNHCPYAVAYEDRLIALTKEFSGRGIGVAAISSNDKETQPQDSFDNMKTRAKEKGFNFPYLYDESQAVALAYGPTVTPHIFLFDSTLTLVYRGRIDDNAKPNEVKQRDLTDALTALVAGGKIENADTKEFGCSIKWRADVLKTGKAAQRPKPGEAAEQGS